MRAQAGALRLEDPFALEVASDVKHRGLKMYKTRRVPNGYLFLESKGAIKRLDVMPKPTGEGLSFGEARKQENKSGYLFPVDFITALVTTNRAGLAYFSGLTEQSGS